MPGLFSKFQRYVTISSNNTPPPTRSFEPLSFLFILGLTAFAHRQSLSGWFQVDDFLWLKLASLSSVADSFVHSWGHGVAYRPIMRVSFYLDALLFGWHGKWWHFENVLIASIDGLLIYRLAGRYSLPPLARLLAGSLFAIEPIGVDNVDWISGRTGLLSLAWLLLAITAWIDGWPNRWRRAAVPVAVFYVVGMATYEAGAVLPALLVPLIPWIAIRYRASVRDQILSIGLISIVGGLFWLIRSHLLGAVGAQVDDVMPSLQSALTVNSPIYLEYFSNQWGEVAVAAVLFSLLISILRRDSLVVALSLVAMAAMLCGPFIILKGLAPRFLFLAQAPVCILLALPLAAPIGGARLGYAALLAMIVVHILPITERGAYEMKRAGRLAHQIMTGIEALSTDPTINLVFDNIPNNYNGKPVFWYKFEDAMMARFALSHNSIVHDELMMNDPDLRHQLLSQPTRFYHFKPETLEFIEMSRDQWIAVHAAALAGWPIPALTTDRPDLK